MLVPFASLGVRTGVALALGAAIGASVQIGDLVESLLKREGGVKDSSHMTNSVMRGTFLTNAQSRMEFLALIKD